MKTYGAKALAINVVKKDAPVHAMGSNAMSSRLASRVNETVMSANSAGPRALKEPVVAAIP